ncbi:MAG: kelch repeat-containing protein [Cystobacter sp.]
MKRIHSSLLFSAVWSLCVGCGPASEGTPPAVLESQSQSLAGEVGVWTRTSESTYGAYSAVLLRGGDVLTSLGGFTQRYNPYTNTWRTMSPMCSPGRCGDFLFTPFSSGKVLAYTTVLDRTGGSGSWMAYSPATEEWLQIPGPHESRRNVTTTLLGSGKVLVVGGYFFNYRENTVLGTAEEYDSATDAWTALPGSLATPRYDHSATLLYSGKVLVVGGLSAQGEKLTSAELYDPATRTWTAAGSMTSARSRHLAIRLNSGSVMVLGDDGPGTAPGVELYDPYNGRWSQGPALAIARPVTATLLYSGEVLVTGDGGEAAVYSPSQNAWLPAPSSGVAASRAAAVRLTSGEVFLVGSYVNAAARYKR